MASKKFDKTQSAGSSQLVSFQGAVANRTAEIWKRTHPSMSPEESARQFSETRDHFALVASENGVDPDVQFFQVLQQIEGSDKNRHAYSQRYIDENQVWIDSLLAEFIVNVLIVKDENEGLTQIQRLDECLERLVSAFVQGEGLAEINPEFSLQFEVTLVDMFSSLIHTTLSEEFELVRSAVAAKSSNVVNFPSHQEVTTIMCVEALLFRCAFFLLVLYVMETSEVTPSVDSLQRQNELVVEAMGAIAERCFFLVGRIAEDL